jgi:hypothetical protein
MANLIPIVLVLLLVSGAITFIVLRATRQSKPSEAESHGDPSPAGDTPEHAGEQSHRGETVEAPEGEGEPSGGDGRGGVRRGEGEGEGSRAEAPDAPRPDSERLADRHQV